MITKIDNTMFSVDLLDVYRTLIKSFLLQKLNEYSKADYNQSKDE